MAEVSAENKAKALAAKNEGNEFYKKKNFDKAHESYDQAIELDPTDMTYRNNKAAVYFEQAKYQDCIAECERAAHVGRENRNDFKLIAKAFARMGTAFLKLDDLENARTYLQKSLTEHRTPDTLTKLSEVEKQLKEHERLAYIDTGKSLEEKTLGNTLFQKGDYPGAIKHYTEAIKRNPEDAKIFSNRAACYQKLTEFNLALKDSEECIRLDPTFIKGYIRKGLALVAMKEMSKAQVAYQKALEIDENNSEAIEGYRKCSMATSDNPEEIRNRAMNDPEIQSILSDPAMRIILEQMQSDPKAIQEHLRNPAVAEKMMKLMECGIVRMGQR